MGVVLRDCAVCPEMVVVPPGSFMMGSPDSEEDRSYWEGPQHRVTIDYPVAVGVYEVTFERMGRVRARRRLRRIRAERRGRGRGRRPVINVGWEEAWRYVDWLTERTGEEYRLLSEAEWEYVTRREPRRPDMGREPAGAVPARERIRCRRIRQVSEYLWDG